MMTVWSRDSIRDLRELRNYIAEFDPAAANNTARRIIEAVEMLSEFPGMGRPGRMPHTRELVISGTPYIVPYLVTEGRIEIIAIVHGARKWPE